MMDRLRAYLRAEREKLRPLSRRARAEYVWQYYKLWILGIGFLLFLTLYIIVIRLTVPQDNWFYLTLANTYADVGEGSDFWRGFVDYGGYDTSEKHVYFNGSCYFDPSSGAYNAYYTYFVAYVQAGTLDAIAMEREDLEALGARGWLLDLTLPEAGDLAARYADRLVYAVPEEGTYGPDPVPIGIDLSDTALVDTFHIYADTCALGISSNCPHFSEVERFLDYVFSLENG